MYLCIDLCLEFHLLWSMNGFMMFSKKSWQEITPFSYNVRVGFHLFVSINILATYFREFPDEKNISQRAYCYITALRIREDKQLLLLPKLSSSTNKLIRTL